MGAGIVMNHIRNGLKVGDDEEKMSYLRASDSKQESCIVEVLHEGKWIAREKYLRLIFRNKRKEE